MREKINALYNCNGWVNMHVRYHLGISSDQEKKRKYSSDLLMYISYIIIVAITSHTYFHLFPSLDDSLVNVEYYIKLIRLTAYQTESSIDK